MASLCPGLHILSVLLIEGLHHFWTDGGFGWDGPLWSRAALFHWAFVFSPLGEQWPLDGPLWCLDICIFFRSNHVLHTPFSTANRCFKVSSRLDSKYTPVALYECKFLLDFFLVFGLEHLYVSERDSSPKNENYVIFYQKVSKTAFLILMLRDKNGCVKLNLRDSSPKNILMKLEWFQSLHWKSLQL